MSPSTRLRAQNSPSFSSSSSSSSSSVQKAPASTKTPGLTGLFGSSSSSLHAQVLDGDVDKAFKTAFNIKSAKVKINLTKHEKIQAILLLSRMQKEANQSSHFVTNYNELRGELNDAGYAEIPFSVKHSLTKSIKDQSTKVQKYKSTKKFR